MTINRSVLLDFLKRAQVLIFVSELDILREYTPGVNIFVDSEVISLCGFCSHELFFLRYKNIDNPYPFNITIPAPQFENIISILDGIDSESVELKKDNAKLKLQYTSGLFGVETVGNIEIIDCSDSDFDYISFVPDPEHNLYLPEVAKNNWWGKFMLNRLQLIGILTKHAPFANPDSRRVTFIFEDNRLTIETRIPHGEILAVDNIEICFNGKKIRTSFNIDYLLAAIQELDGEIVKMQCGIESCISGFYGSTFMYALMPVSDEYRSGRQAAKQKYMSHTTEFFIELTEKVIKIQNATLEKWVLQIYRRLLAYFREKPTSNFTRSEDYIMKILHHRLWEARSNLVHLHILLYLCSQISDPEDKYPFTDEMKDTLIWLEKENDLDEIAAEYGISPVRERGSKQRRIPVINLK